MIEAHRHGGVFIARGKEDALVTKNLVPGADIALTLAAPSPSPVHRVPATLSCAALIAKRGFALISAGSAAHVLAQLLQT